MTAFDPQLIILSKATYVNASAIATAAATYSFYTSDYHPPTQERYIDQDIVKNQNGKFKWVYDNGPGFRKWAPFKVHAEHKLGDGATTTLNNLTGLWEHPGVMGMKAPDGVYQVIWGDSAEKAFRVFPNNSTDPREFTIEIQLEEA